MLQEINNKINFLQEDFVGIKFYIPEIISVIANFLIAISLFLIFYLIGKKIKLLFCKKCNRGLEYFIDIAFGYIAVGTGIGILGMFSLLYSHTLLIYSAFIVVAAFYPFQNVNELIEDILYIFKIFYKHFKRNKWILTGALLFILIAFLRLLLPETGVDALSYHTDFPHLYLKFHTTMVNDIKGLFYLIPIPQLGEMSYLITDFAGYKDASRFINFMFYLLVIIVLSYVGLTNKRYKFFIYAPILFVTAPVVIRHSSSANVNFQWIFCWLLLIIILTRNKKIIVSDIALAGILFGGILATKIWTLAFLPLIVFYITLTSIKNKIYLVKLIAVFIFFGLLISSIWYIRAYILTGNPVYPAFAKEFHNWDNLVFPKPANLSSYISEEGIKFRLSSILNLSPLLLVGAIFVLPKLNYFKKFLTTYRLFLFFILLSVQYALLPWIYYVGHYLYGWYSVGVLFFSAGIENFVSKYRSFKYIFVSLFIGIFLYYFTNTLLNLPYGLGWADKNRYLTRILSIDNSSFYDFDRLFDKFISKNDIVATHRIYGFYYANFNYIDISHIFDKEGLNFDLLRKKSVTKLIVRGGDINWLCAKLKLIGCNSKKYEQLASYIPSLQYLYAIY